MILPFLKLLLILFYIVAKTYIAEKGIRSVVVLIQRLLSCQSGKLKVSVILIVITNWYIALKTLGSNNGKE